MSTTRLTLLPNPHPKYWYCSSTEENNLSEPSLSPFYFISFTVISALVMLSLFVGAVTMSMAASMDTMKAEAEESAKAKREEKLKQQAEQVEVAKPAAGAEEENDDEAKASGKKDRQRKKMQKLMNRALDGGDMSAGGEEDEEDHGHEGFKAVYVKWSSKVR